MKKFFDSIPAFLLAKNFTGVEALIFTCLLLWGFCNNLSSVEYYPDENFWISSTIRFDKFLAGDFFSYIWSDSDPLTSYEVRPMPSYFAALGQRLGGITQQDLPIYWDWEGPTAKNILQGALPSAKVLWWSRLPMAIISVLSLLGIVFLLAKAHSRLAGYVFGVVSFNPYFLIHLRRALSEPSLIFFTVLTLYASYKLLVAAQEAELKKILLWSAVVGIFSGLAGESKLTGLACAGIAILGMIILMVDPLTSRQLTQKRLPLWITGTISVGALLAFIISYPFFYQHTLDRILTTFYIRSSVVQYQVYTYSYQTIQPGDRLSILFQRIFDYPLTLATHGILVVFFHWINLILAILGLAYCLRQVLQKRKDWEYFLVFLLGAFVCAGPMLFTPLDWERYYLYPIFFSCIFFSIAVGEFLYRWISSSRKQQPAKPGEQEIQE